MKKNENILQVVEVERRGSKCKGGKNSKPHINLCKKVGELPHSTLGCYCHIKNAICRFSSFINHCEITTSDTLKSRQTVCICSSSPEEHWCIP